MFNALKRQLALLAVTTSIGVVSLLSILAFTSPDQGTWFTFCVLYASFFLVMLGFFSFLGLIVRARLPVLPAEKFSNSFRQAFLLSLLATTSFVLLAQDILLWWVEASLILFFVVIEVLFNLKT